MDEYKDDIVELAEHILDTIREVFIQEEVDLPKRQYLAIGGQGDTVHDCEQLTISFEQSYSGLPGDQAQTPVKCDMPHSAVFIVELVRAIPTANSSSSTEDTPTIPAATGRYANVKVSAPDPDIMTQAARKQMIDARVLLKAGLTATDSRELVGGIADVSAGSPSGGYQAMIMSVITTI